MTSHETLAVAHVAEPHQRYPGDPLNFFTRVEVKEPVAGYVLRVLVPAGLTLDDYSTPGTTLMAPRVVRWPEGHQTVTWEWTDSLEAGTAHEYRVGTTVETHPLPTVLMSHAYLERTGALEDERLQESTAVEIETQSRWLQHLPALYDNDPLMGRFLMLFESFWGPIDDQIRQLHYLFDPRTTPSDLLPWLAAWLDLTLDTRWPEAKRRELIRHAVHLYRTRGTRRGLVDFLTLYTNVQPEIVEHRAHNFRLGNDTRLGQGVALGTKNAPHTFTVTLSLPALTTKESQLRRQMIEQIIETEKPAHTAYELIIEEGA